MIHVELVGCTSSGKSTLVDAMLRAGRARGIDTQTGDDFVLAPTWAGRLTHRAARVTAVDLLALLACVRTWRRNGPFCSFAIRVLWRLPVPPLQKINLIRNVVKKLGVYEIVRARSREQVVVIVDEGTVHAAHNLFVHVAVPPRWEEVELFAHLVPLPDVVVNVSHDQAVLAARTLARRHPRVPQRGWIDAQHFIQRATATFDLLGRQPWIEERSVFVDNQRGTVAVRADKEDPSIGVVLDIVSAGLANAADAPAAAVAVGEPG